jgi:S1-C subfamily serine protease
MSSFDAPCRAFPLFAVSRKCDDKHNCDAARLHMTKLLISVLALMGVVTPIRAQDAPVRVKLRAVLVDKDLNQKPLPFLLVRLKSDGAGQDALEAKTDLTGTAALQVPAGHYTITAAKPVEVAGKRYTWSVEAEIRGTDQEIDLTNDNAKIETLAAEPASAASAPGTDLTGLFSKLKNSVVTVRAEAGNGSGFLVDSSGLIVTNNHVVQSSKYLAVQFDQKRKVPAQLVASDVNKDVAVLWVNLAAFPEFVLAPMTPADTKTPLVVGQQVFAIGNPLGREKVLTTGVISKLERDAITSDININPGNSGGPLFTMNGQVAGITTALLRKLASIVPIEYARPLLEQARKTISGAAPPPTTLLPVEPTDYYPSDYLRGLLSQEKMDFKPYFYDLGQFQVTFITPPISYFSRHQNEMWAARKDAKRTAGDSSQAQPPSEALEDAQEYRPVVVVSVRPKLGFFVKVRFKNGFQSMRLLCGGKEIAPIDPGRSEFDLVDTRNRTIDTTFQGRYSYLPDAISPECGSVVLEVYSEKDPTTPISKTIDPATLQRIWADLEPYRKAQLVK